MSFTWTDWRRCGFCERLCHPSRLATTLAHPRNGVVYHICAECFSDRLRVTTGTLAARRSAAVFAPRRLWPRNYTDERNWS